MIRVTFVSADGAERLEVEAPAGISLLKLAHFNGVNMEGACGGSMACSTCHVILSEADFDRLPAPAEEEEDMLDLTVGAVATSRLGCQILLTEAMDGLVARLPVVSSDQRG